MTRESWSRGFVGSVLGGLFGAVLLLLAISQMVGGHGTYLPLAIFGAPFTMIADDWVGFLAVPAVWATIGFVLGAARRSPIPVTVLLLHLSGVGAVLLWGSGYESGEEQWQYLERAQLYVAAGIRVAFVTYAAGHLGAWVVVAGKWFMRVRSNQPAA